MTVGQLRSELCVWLPELEVVVVDGDEVRAAVVRVLTRCGTDGPEIALAVDAKFDLGAAD